MNFGHLKCEMPVEPSDDNFWQGVGHRGLELRVKSRIPLPARSRDSAWQSSASGQPEQALPVWSVFGLRSSVSQTCWNHECYELIFNSTLNGEGLKF